MNKYRWVWIGCILVVALLLGGCAQPAVTEEVVEPPTVEAPPTEVPATDTPEVVEPEIDEPEIEEPEVEEPVEEEVVVEEPPVDEDEGLTEEDIEMQALISDKIGGCHMLNFILRQNKTREEWSVTIDRMIGKGAQVNEEEKALIIDYLVSRDQ